MNKEPEFSQNYNPSDAHSPRSGGSLRVANGQKGGLLRDRRFLRALAASVVLHAALFVWVSLAPSQPTYRFFGSGTAVSLVGADEIPGGSAREKSGDRPQDMEAPTPRKGPDEGTRKIAAPEKKTTPAKVKKKKIVKKKTPRKEVRRIPKKNPQKVVRKKKKRDPAREASLRRIRERRERARRWRNRFKKNEKNRPAKTKKRPRDNRMSDDRLAKADLAPKGRGPLKGYAGEGGGDGQGGGSRAGGSGGVAETDLQRYGGLLSERIHNYWTVPLNLSDASTMRAAIEVDVNREGVYRNLRLVRSSGNRIYDQTFLRAAERAFKSGLPKPPDTIKENWNTFNFRVCGKGFCR